jgi:hypothetical protein
MLGYFLETEANRIESSPNLPIHGQTIHTKDARGVVRHVPGRLPYVWLHMLLALMTTDARTSDDDDGNI